MVKAEGNGYIGGKKGRMKLGESTGFNSTHAVSGPHLAQV